MEIAFFTEMNFEGKIPRTHENMRTEFAWMTALNATHYPINNKIFTQQYDLGIVIIPKKNPGFDISHLKNSCKQLAVMQEGPNWNWQDYSLEHQIWYLNTLIQADIIYTHNKIDKLYYSGLVKHSDVRVLPSLMIEDAVGELPKVERKNVMIGGNFVSWYGGVDSYMVAQEFDCDLYIPSMGRKQPGEEQLERLNPLPYMTWKQWIHKLNEFKYGVHLMRTHAAGTFALNCSYLGIPCIGYEGLDTQEILHPDLTVKLGDLTAARKIVERLRKDEEFYVHCSQQTKELYKQHYHENIFNTTFKKQLEISQMEL